MEFRGRLLAFLEYRDMLLKRVDFISQRNISKRVKPNLTERIKQSNISKYVNFFSVNYYCTADAEIGSQMRIVYNDIERIWPQWFYIKQLLETVGMTLEYEAIVSEIEEAIENEEIDHIKKRNRKFGLFPKMEISENIVSKINLLRRKALREANEIVTNTTSAIDPDILFHHLPEFINNQGVVGAEIM